MSVLRRRRGGGAAQCFRCLSPARAPGLPRAVPRGVLHCVSALLRPRAIVTDWLQNMLVQSECEARFAYVCLSVELDGHFLSACHCLKHFPVTGSVPLELDAAVETTPERRD